MPMSASHKMRSCQRTLLIGVRLAAASGWACLLLSCQMCLKVAAASKILHNEHNCMRLVPLQCHCVASIRATLKFVKCSWQHHFRDAGLSASRTSQERQLNSAVSNMVVHSILDDDQPCTTM